jgi:CTP synthase
MTPDAHPVIGWVADRRLVDSESGLSPDILVCRSEYQLDESIRRKIAQFCNVDVEDVIASLDAESIYEVPLLMQSEGLDSRVIEKLDLEAGEADLERWTAFVDKIKSPKHQLRIALVGKYVEHHDAYKSIVEALIHGGAENDCKVTIEWMQSDFISKENVERKLNHVSGVLVAPGFGDRGIDGKLEAVRYARENNIPFFGICLGMQCAVIEYARNVCGKKEAHSTEFSGECGYPIIDLMPDQKDLQETGGTMRLGTYACRLMPGSKALKAYGEELIHERHRHRYEVNNFLRDDLKEHGLLFAGINPERDLVEIIEIENHPWYVGVQFHPELKSTVGKPHPLFAAFVKASLDRKFEFENADKEQPKEAV